MCQVDGHILSYLRDSRCRMETSGNIQMERLTTFQKKNEIGYYNMFTAHGLYTNQRLQCAFGHVIYENIRICPLVLSPVRNDTPQHRMGRELVAVKKSLILFLFFRGRGFWSKQSHMLCNYKTMHFYTLFLL